MPRCPTVWFCQRQSHRQLPTPGASSSKNPTSSGMAASKCRNMCKANASSPHFERWPRVSELAPLWALGCLVHNSFFPIHDTARFAMRKSELFRASGAGVRRLCRLSRPALVAVTALRVRGVADLVAVAGVGKVHRQLFEQHLDAGLAVRPLNLFWGPSWPLL